MSTNERLFHKAEKKATRWYVFHPEVFKDFEALVESKQWSAAKLNQAVTDGLGFNITCAVNQDGSNFDLGDSETDDSLTFCQIAGAANPTSFSPDITLEIETSRDRTQTNTANTAHDLFAYRDAEYYFVLSVGEDPSTDFAEGDRVKIARRAVDYGAYQIGSGENIRLQVNTANRGDVAWNQTLVA